MIMRSLSSLILASATVYATPTQAELFGISIGINNYGKGVTELRGAENDARDVSNAIAKLTARQNLIVLTDKSATRRNIKASWKSTLGRAEPKDTIILHFAGHGSQEPEPAGRSGERDQKNENFLLSGFHPQAPFNRERLVDDEVFQWLQRAETKGVNVIFVADSCFSGGMARSVPSVVDDAVRYRTAGEFTFEVDAEFLPPPAIAKVDEDSFKRVTFVAATVENRKVPEVVIDGEYRGALSWAFARALEGAADRNADGWLTQRELTEFLLPQVEAKVEGQQTPEVLPLRSTETRLLRLGPSTPPKHSSTSLRVAVVGPLSGSFNATHAEKSGVTLVSARSDTPDIIWDSGTGAVVHVPGGVVGHADSVEDLVSILGKFTGIKWLRANAYPSPLFAQLTSGNDRYYRNEGKRISIEITGFSLPHLTLFNLAPNGRIEFFLPKQGRTNQARNDWRGRRFARQLKVDRPPYGAEHLVAIATKEPVYGLHALLRRMASGDEWASLPRALRDQLHDVDFQIGIINIYTGDTHGVEQDKQ